jgi:rhamnosyltransferase
VGIVGSNYQEWTTDQILFNNREENETWAVVENLPTSGSLNSIKVFEEVGNFRDEFFIDYIDTDYCMRVRERGFVVIISPKICMQHPLGYYKPSKLYKFLCGRLMVTNYPSFRHYYWTRNGIILIRERFWKNSKWAINELYYLLFKRPLTIILFEDNKWQKIIKIFLGIFHAFFSKVSSVDRFIERK